MQRRLQKAGIDLGSIRTQLFIAIVICVFAAFINYAGTLKDGFLLDDFLHLNYCARALAGDWQPFLMNFTGNWGGSDLMLSYRPVVSLSILFDYLLYRTNPWGYHFTNLVIFAACTALAASLSLVLTQRLAPRLCGAAALFGGLLFAAYPLHAETVAWIIGRVDSLATLFYLASLLLFLRARTHGSKDFRRLSLLSFLLALTSKEIAVSLPFAVFIVTFILDLPQNKPLTAAKNAIKASLPYLGLLLAFALVRQLILGTTIGGYGRADIWQSLSNFLNRDSLIKIIVPVSEEYHYLSKAIKPAVLPVALITLLAVVRSLLHGAPGKLKILLSIPLLMLWCFIALLPAFQIWHIYPNLVGSRLFFLSSVPLCLVLTMKALPGHIAVDKKKMTIWLMSGCLALSSLYLIWCHLLQINLQAWHHASSRMEKFDEQITKLAMTNAKVALANLPQDYKGAGMIGRRLYLDILVSPPLKDRSLSERLLTAEKPGEYFDRKEWKEIVKELSKGAPLVYFDNNTENFYVYKAPLLSLQSWLKQKESKIEPKAESRIEPKKAAKEESENKSENGYDCLKDLLQAQANTNEKDWMVVDKGATTLTKVVSPNSCESLEVAVAEKPYILTLDLPLPSLLDSPESDLVLELKAQKEGKSIAPQVVLIDEKGELAARLPQTNEVSLSAIKALAAPAMQKGRLGVYLEPGNTIIEKILLKRLIN
ncbi:MAG: hypothetical protein J0M35_10875 [Candidatus Obscuribacter phosphatis]|uniref:Glycosyltransferase RgtA/B/C/D-like domain-containing protein n=1 Tax=Candidatus Obscuribacter phosphatis TaxID=1906157 RepID=A0A8J7TMI9_9BACT|nr:hypothetical protein [Candidatus Obscuribacter phosphatis]